MSSRYLLYSDLKKRNIMFKKESTSFLLHCLYNEHLLYSDPDNIDSLHLPFFHFSHYLSFKRTFSSMYKSKVRNRCVYSGNGRAIFSTFKLSRFFFKMLARSGSINGISKSSW